MNQTLRSRLVRAFDLTHDLIAHLESDALGADLPNLPSNRISGQVWCIVGARESYLRAIEAGSWQGFACSLKEPGNKAAVMNALQETRGRLARIDFGELSGPQIELAFDLHEHEIQHHGQLIRYVYGNRLSFPDSWHQRYTV